MMANSTPGTASRMMKSRVLRIVLIAGVLLALAVWAFRPQPVPADFATVGRGPLEVAVEEEGQTRVRDRYVVSAPVPGRVRRVELEPGDPVIARKTVVAQLEPTDPGLQDVRTRSELQARLRAAESAIGSARADRDRIRAELAFAQAELKRSRALVEEKVIAPRELEATERQVQTLERALQSADFAVRTAQHQAEVARSSLIPARTGAAGTVIPLVSPVDGVVLRRLQESAAVVAAAQPLVEIGNLADLEIVSDLLSSAAVAVEPGQRVSIEQWGGSRPLKGRVQRVEPSGFTKISALGVEEQRVNVIIDFDEPRSAWQQVGDGYRVEVRIVTWRKDDVLKVPTSSLFRHEGKWAVYTVDGGRASRRLLAVGERNGLEAEVLGGLNAGDQIIVFPSDAITDGAKVTARSPG
jgi:HlyD family secretion protein